jgi:hypothetical protein
MIASILIILFSVCMFLYWLRYTCLLVLENAPVEEPCALPGIGHILMSGNRVAASDVPVSELYRQLDRDYRILRRLLAHYPEGESIEQKLLVVDYAAMKLWSRIVRPFSPSTARRAMVEMGRVLDYFSAELSTAVALSD